MLEGNGLGDEMSRRAFLRLGVAGVSGAVALFVAGCGGADEEEDEEEDDD